MTPVVTVIIIFLNEERFIAEAVESVLRQTYGDWELLLCDDGSTDRSPHIAQQYANAHPNRIRYLTHPGGKNRGMSATRNLGLSHAAGEFVAFLDADDVWLPRKLEVQVEALQKNPGAAVVYSSTLFWHSWTDNRDEGPPQDSMARMAASPGRLAKGTTVLRRILTSQADPVYTCSALIRREAALGVGGFEDRFVGLFEDQVFFSKLLLAHDVFATGVCTDLYRQHPDSCCSEAHRSGIVIDERRAEFLGWFFAYLTTRRAPLALRWTVRREIWLQRHPVVLQARFHLREGGEKLYGGAVSLAFGLGRLILPTATRQWLWSRSAMSQQQIAPPNRLRDELRATLPNS